MPNPDLPAIVGGGVCPVCGERQFVLAEELVRYTEVTFVNGSPVKECVRTEALDSLSGETVRMFCTSCGTYVQVPEETA